MKKIYLDNACTSFPKPEGVAKAMYDYITGCGGSVNRSSHSAAGQAEDAVFFARELITELFNGYDIKNTVFTSGVTESLNAVINGLLTKEDHVIVSSVEHNAVMRPIIENGIPFSRAACDETGALDLKSVEALIEPRTKAIIMTHASNVSGTLLPIGEIGELSRARGLMFITDAAQTAGVFDIDVKKMNISALCFTGHKSLLGPQGTGGIVLAPDAAERLRPFKCGGTGSVSDSEKMPDFLPDRLEAGTPNIPGIIGLAEGVKYIKERGTADICAHEAALAERFLAALFPLEAAGKIRIIGKRSFKGRAGVVSVAALTRPLAETAALLDERYGVMTRVGLHCAPAAHKTFGTFPSGTIRFSFGAFNENEDADAAAEALKELL